MDKHKWAREGLHDGSSKRIQCALLALSSWPSRKAEAGSKARLCRCKRFPSAPNEFQEGCPLHSRVYLASNSASKCMTRGGWSWRRNSQQHVSRWQVVDKRMLGSSKQKTASGRFMRKQKTKTIFSEFICSRSNDAPESDHSFDVCMAHRDVPTRQICSQMLG